MIGFIWYTIYFALSKKYFTELKYPTYVDEDKTDKLEFDAVYKYLIFYSFIIIILFLFSFMVMNYICCFDVNKSLFFAVVFIIFLIMFFTSKVFQFILTRDTRKLFNKLPISLLWQIGLIIIVLTSKWILKCILYIAKMLTKIKLKNSS